MVHLLITILILLLSSFLFLFLFAAKLFRLDIDGFHLTSCVHINLYVQYQDHLASRMEDYKGDGQKASKMLVKLFPTKIHLQQPQVSIRALAISGFMFHMLS